MKSRSFKIEEDYGYADYAIECNNYKKLFNSLTLTDQDHLDLSQNDLPIGIIRMVEVYDDYRNEGYGNDLMCKAIDSLVEYGAKTIVLLAEGGSAKNTERLEKWYKSFKFKTIHKNIDGCPIMKHTVDQSSVNN